MFESHGARFQVAVLPPDSGVLSVAPRLELQAAWIPAVVFGPAHIIEQKLGTRRKGSGGGGSVVAESVTVELSVIGL